VPFSRKSRCANAGEKLALSLEAEAAKNNKAWLADRVALVRITKPYGIAKA
jgi:hypothetical protein